MKLNWHTWDKPNSLEEARLRRELLEEQIEDIEDDLADHAEAITELDATGESKSEKDWRISAENAKKLKRQEVRMIEAWEQGTRDRISYHEAKAARKKARAEERPEVALAKAKDQAAAPKKRGSGHVASPKNEQWAAAQKRKAEKAARHEEHQRNQVGKFGAAIFKLPADQVTARHALSAALILCVRLMRRGRQTLSEQEQMILDAVAVFYGREPVEQVPAGHIEALMVGQRLAVAGQEIDWSAVPMAEGYGIKREIGVGAPEGLEAAV